MLPFIQMKLLWKKGISTLSPEPSSGELEFNIDAEAHEAAAEKYRPLWEEWDRQNAQQDAAQ